MVTGGEILAGMGLLFNNTTDLHWGIILVSLLDGQIEKSYIQGRDSKVLKDIVTRHGL